MRQLKDINGKLRICTRCNSGEPAVFKKSSEWLCEKCLERRKERQATTAAMPKCHKCNAPAMHGLPYCNNHVPQVDPVHELECRVTVLEQQLQQAQAELASYKQGVEVEMVVREHFMNDIRVAEMRKAQVLVVLPMDMFGQSVRVLVRAIEPITMPKEDV